MEENNYSRELTTIETKLVYCPQNDFSSDPQSVEKCKNCMFFDCENEKSITCLYDGPLLKEWKGVHALKFEDRRFTYESHSVNELTKEEYDEYVENGYDCCKWCCFNRKLSNNEEYCFLRNACCEEDRTAFTCYDGEFYIAKPNKKD